MQKGIEELSSSNYFRSIIFSIFYCLWWK